MDVGRRAKQFAPFAALRGLDETIRQQEIIYEPKRDLSEAYMGSGAIKWHVHCSVYQKHYLQTVILKIYRAMLKFYMD